MTLTSIGDKIQINMTDLCSTNAIFYKPEVEKSQSFYSGVP